MDLSYILWFILYISLILYERLTFVLAAACPKTFDRGTISHWCDREPNESCGFECNEDCYPAFSYLTCHEGGIWINAHEACICSDSTDSSICPTTIPNGKLSPNCRRSPLSQCTFTCDANCFATTRYVYCKDFGHTARWHFGSVACKCYEPTTIRVTEAEEKKETSSTVIVVVAILCGIIIPILIVLTIACIIIKRTRASRFTPSPTAAATSAPAYSETMRHTSSTQNGQFTSVQAQNTSRSDIQSSSPAHLNVNSRVNSNVNTHVNSHNSSEHVPVTRSVSVPMTPPPSYEEVQAHPLEFSKKDDV